MQICHHGAAHLSGGQQHTRLEHPTLSKRSTTWHAPRKELERRRAQRQRAPIQGIPYQEVLMVGKAGRVGDRHTTIPAVRRLRWGGPPKPEPRAKRECVQNVQTCDPLANTNTRPCLGDIKQELTSEVDRRQHFVLLQRGGNGAGARIADFVHCQNKFIELQS